MVGRVLSAKDWKGEAFRRTLVGIVRKRVPERDVEDIVQATLAEGLSPKAPADDDSLQKWLIGVAKHKIADRHRRGQRESFDVPEVPIDAPPHSERDLVRWAERALDDAGDEPKRTLEWMIREGDGEKLESIAESEQVPAPRVRKRVSRLRQHLRAEWKKELALLAALGVLGALVWVATHREPEPVAHEHVAPLPTEVAPTPADRAARIRQDALAACDARAWASCIVGLDRAKDLDPAGDATPPVVTARGAASAALNPSPSPPVPSPPVIAPAPSVAPHGTSGPVAPSRPHRSSGASDIPSGSSL
jgi:DNA-directed RNA polymerase specialized sigma24 family protein